MSNLHLDYLGITQWQLRQPQGTSVETQATLEITAANADWDTLAHMVQNCTKCALCQTRTKTVFGVGNRTADLLVIGEGPGANEDLKGEPFVGQAGQLLDKMLAAIQLSRDSVYIANIVKCRPPNNREPLPAEVSQCLPYLHRQIALIQPKLILALGRVAAHNLLHLTTPLNKLREHTFHFGPTNIPVIVTYHPAYLLRNPADKRNAYQDLLRTQAMLKDFNACI